MANSDAVGQLTQDNFGSFLLGIARQVDLTSTGNAVANIAILGGGVTANTGCYVVRRVSVRNANASAATGNVIILTSNDGNTQNAVTQNTVLTNVAAATVGYQDLTVLSLANATAASALFVKVQTGVAAKVDIAVYGDVVNL